MELGESEIALVGGTESMSQAPYAVRNIRFGTRLGQDLQVSTWFATFALAHASARTYKWVRSSQHSLWHTPRPGPTSEMIIIIMTLLSKDLP